MGALSETGSKHPSAVKARVAVVQTMRQRNEVSRTAYSIRRRKNRLLESSPKKIPLVSARDDQFVELMLVVVSKPKPGVNGDQEMVTLFPTRWALSGGTSDWSVT